jgi:pyridoxal phosphate enzyme (YggS family)
MIHSVDSVYLAREIQTQAKKLDRTIEILIQVNTSGEESKFGLEPEATIGAIEEVSTLPNLKVKGLMTIGAFLPNPEDVRPCFKLLNDLKDRVNERGITSVEIGTLSMGMTNDYEIAIEEGSTMVRVGTAIFGERG